MIKLSDQREAEGFPWAEAVGFVTKLYDRESGRFWMYVSMYLCLYACRAIIHISSFIT